MAPMMCRLSLEISGANHGAKLPGMLVGAHGVCVEVDCHRQASAEIMLGIHSKLGNADTMIHHLTFTTELQFAGRSVLLVQVFHHCPLSCTPLLTSFGPGSPDNSIVLLSDPAFFTSSHVLSVGRGCFPDAYAMLSPLHANEQLL